MMNSHGVMALFTKFSLIELQCNDDQFQFENSVLLTALVNKKK